MSRRSTWLGTMFCRDREAARVEFVAVLRRNRGSVTAAARDLGFDRRYMFRILWRESLWAELDAIRAAEVERGGGRRRPEPDWLAATRAALKGSK